MALNVDMHPRNIYKTPPDFEKLLEEFPSIRKHMITDLSGKVRFDFKSAAGLRELTCALLKRDFSLDVVIPDDHLVPTLPNRLNYVLWMEDLLERLQLPVADTVSGLDVGTGPCAVYCLLGARRGWRMFGTDTNTVSMSTARDNVVRNRLQHLVQVLESGDSMFSPLDGRTVHFSLCNPPFYDSEQPPVPARPGRPPPFAAHTGLPTEISCPGGERAFISRMVKESKQYKDRCRIFSTMLGHKSSVRPMKRLMYETGALQVASCEFCQGNTKRWGLAWTFHANVDIREVTIAKHPKKRPPLQCVVPRNLCGIKYSVPDVKQAVIAWLRELGLTVEEGNSNKYYASYKITAMEDTWSHARRKRRLQERMRTGIVPAPAVTETSGPDVSVGNGALDTSSSSSTSRFQSEEDGCGSPASTTAVKRVHPGDDGDAVEGKRVCLSEHMDRVLELEDAGRQRPVLVLTLFVQTRGPDILLQMGLLAGRLGLDGINALMVSIRNRLKQAASPPAAAGTTTEDVPIQQNSVGADG